jgi:hypothetical protein
MTSAQSGMMTKLLGLMLSAGTPQPKRTMVTRCERAGVAIHIFNGGFLDRTQVKDEADFIESRMHHIVRVPILRAVPEEIIVPKQGKREARRRKRQWAKQAAKRQPLQLAA